MELEVKNVKKSFGGKEVLHGISFQVKSGTALGLLGRNGAGKTTTMRIIMDVFKGDSGEILLDGKPFEPAKERIGYMPEERGLYPKRIILEQMVYLARLRGLGKSEAVENAKNWLKRLEIEEYANRKLETLSKGNQQKVQLAATLVSNPNIVILDEPFSGLDPVNSQILKDVVRDLIQDGKLVIFSSHQMSYVEEFCENVAMIHHGQVVLQGELKQIKKEMGRNQITLVCEGSTIEETKQFIRQRFATMVQVMGNTREGIILKLQENCNKESFLSALLQAQVKISQFGDYEPSLNEIFVMKAGDNQ
ncbi:MAG: ATP-binding cassette domain-containing protein [Lachnospiraceae bacterium]|nr:ATP-binding cassette domain-containing protein [Lachnospiraceae bacterium]